MSTDELPVWLVVWAGFLGLAVLGTLIGLTLAASEGTAAVLRALGAQ